MIDKHRGIQRFLNECCDFGADFKQQSGALYDAYRQFCRFNMEYTCGTTDFYNAIRDAGLLRQKRNTGSYIYGIRLKGEQALFEKAHR